MRVIVNQTNVVVEATAEKERYRTESAFFYALKIVLQAQGYDVIKRLMSRDGHLMGEEKYTHYIRDRKWKFAVIDGNWAVRAVEKEFNDSRSVNLQMVVWES